MSKNKEGVEKPKMNNYLQDILFSAMKILENFTILDISFTRE